MIIPVTMSFPKDFIWGAATASYQIEGAVNEGGRGRSIWDAFCEWPGKVFRGHTGEISCDHYHRMAEDVAIMKEIGLKAYRFSFAWPRLIPDGTGKVNEEGVAFYDRLIDTLLEAGIQPWATLYHWDLPLSLHQRGGWLNPDIPHWFADYTQLIADRFSDRVTHWFTLNEPQVFIGHGYFRGLHAPGMQRPLGECLQAIHHALLAHGRAVQVLRASGRAKPRIGFAPVGHVFIPETEGEADVSAAREATFAVATDPDGPERYKDESPVWNMSWYCDPVFLGRYPETAWNDFGRHVPEVKDGDLKTISQPLDFFGANIYNAATLRATDEGGEVVTPPHGSPMNHYGWDVTPAALYWAGKFYHERYGKEIVITENGIPVIDWVTPDGKVHDPARIAFVTAYLQGVKRALDEGVPFSGYFYWSLLDNFEWNEGYQYRFGLVHVDFQTLRRTPKESSKWYAELIRSNGGTLGERFA